MQAHFKPNGSILLRNERTGKQSVISTADERYFELAMKLSGCKRNVLESKDASGHEHASDTGQFTSGSGGANKGEGWSANQKEMSAKVDFLENVNYTNMAKLPISELSKYGLDDSEVAKISAVSNKHKPKITRKKDAFDKADFRVKEHIAKWESWKKENPIPDVLPEPEQKEINAPENPPDDATPEQEAAYDKAYVEYEKAVEEDEKEYDKAYSAHEKSIEKADKWDEKNDEFESKKIDLEIDAEDKSNELEDVKAERFDDIENHIADIIQPKIDALYDKINANDEPEEEDVQESAESGFTGIDSHGHKWQNGKQVKRDEEQPAEAPAPHESLPVLEKSALAAIDKVAGWIGTGDDPGPIARAFNWMHNTSSAGFKMLPERVQQAVSLTLTGAFAGYTASQSIAERLAKERGCTPEQAKTLRTVFAALDLAAFKATAGPLAAAGPIGVAASWTVPPVTAAYLVSASLSNPMAAYRVAKATIGDIIRASKGKSA